MFTSVPLNAFISGQGWQLIIAGVDAQANELQKTTNLC